MKAFKNIFIEVTAYFFILLFCYAAVSKLVDFENFQVQIAQSPMLSSFTNIISYGVITIELMVSVLLIFVRTRKSGLFLSYLLMVFFTAYIYIILNYSEFIPCSCGGILEKMGWQTHLIFNIVCVVLAFVSLITIDYCSKAEVLKSISYLLFFGIGSSLFLFYMHRKSEEMLHQENAFIRRFPQHPISENARLSLGLNSYYFAGVNGDTIYLGNTTSPFVLTKITDFKNIRDFNLKSSSNSYHFQAPTIHVSDNKIYLTDGTIPVVYQGLVGNQNLNPILQPKQKFNKIAFVNDGGYILSSHNRSFDIQTLGKISKESPHKITWKPDLLKKNQDGYFEPDGMLLYDKSLNRVVYVYYYKNQFIVTDSHLNLKGTFRTIDSLSVPKIDVVKMSDGSKKIGNKAIIVNKKTLVHKGVLFIESDRVGKYEYKDQWKRAVTMDMYSITNQKYLGSFYVPKPKGQKRMQYAIDDQNLYIIIENEIIRYRFAQNITSHFISGEAENLNQE